MKRLIVICGDQLNPSAQVLSDFDTVHDAIVMTEALEEATPRQHKKRLIMFFAAMRQFRNARRAEGKKVYYYALDDSAEKQTLISEVNFEILFRHMDTSFNFEFFIVKNLISYSFIWQN